MQENQTTTRTWRIGFDLAAFVVLAAIAGMVAAMTLAGIAILLTGAGSGQPLWRPDPLARDRRLRENQATPYRRGLGDLRPRPAAALRRAGRPQPVELSGDAA